MNLLMSDLKDLSLIKQVSGEGVRNSVKVRGGIPFIGWGE